MKNTTEPPIPDSDVPRPPNNEDTNHLPLERMIAGSNKNPTNRKFRVIAWTKIDAADQGRLSQHRWLARWDEHTGSYYAFRKETGPQGETINIQLAREVLNLPRTLKESNGIMADHINGDSLDNTRDNLRPATQNLNRANRHPKKTGLNEREKNPKSEITQIDEVTLGIQLQNGGIALIDAEDRPKVEGHKWCGWKDPKKNVTYVRRTDSVLKGGRSFFLHREILDLGFGDKDQVDHKNKNGQDCRKENLRIATTTENNQNKPVRKDSQTGFKGVSSHYSSGFTARIKVGDKRILLLSTRVIEEAIYIYNEAAKISFGEFATLNPLDENLIDEQMRKNLKSRAMNKVRPYLP